jgi:hypothetical protein
MTATETLTEVTAPLNFAADRSPDGVWSNLAPHLRTQALRSQKVRLTDARLMPTPSDLDREGFVLAHHPLGKPAWHDDAWVDETYNPACTDLVRRLTGAPYAVPFHRGVLLRDASGGAGAPAADFVHLDNTQEALAQFLERAAPAEIRERYGRVRVYNVWRATTPPPQDVPLALCDQRTVDRRDWVIGRTIEPDFPEGVPYIASMANAAHRWYFFSNLTADDAVVFKGYDSDSDAPPGCLHGAFRHPAPGAISTPRASAEMRVFVLS